MLRIASAEPKSTDYRSRARRLRHVYRNDPIELHRRLRSLAKVTDEQAVTPRYTPSSKARTYADFLSDQIDSSSLRYSKRLELIRAADNYGISRFEANLLIAAVQHQTEEQPTAKPATPSTHSWALPLATAIVMQLALIACILWALN